MQKNEKKNKNEHGKGVTPMTAKQIRFISELLQHGTVQAAIVATGISSSTAYKWMKDAEFRGELDKRKSDLLDSVSIAMQSGFTAAVKELNQVIQNPATPPQVKVNAIDCLFRNARPIIEEVDILKRLTAIEEGLKAGDVNGKG